VEEEESGWIRVLSKECVPLWPLYGGRNYVCRVAGTAETTVPFSALDPNPSLLMLANKYGGIDVRSKLDSAQVRRLQLCQTIMSFLVKMSLKFTIIE